MDRRLFICCFTGGTQFADWVRRGDMETGIYLSGSAAEGERALLWCGWCSGVRRTGGGKADCAEESRTPKIQINLMQPFPDYQNRGTPV